MNSSFRLLPSSFMVDLRIVNIRRAAAFDHGEAITVID
jgi:hypothetical protein